MGGDNNLHQAPTTSHWEIVMVGGEQLRVSGGSAELVRTARVVLHEFFNACGGPQTDTMGRSSESVGSQDTAMASPPRSKNNSGESYDMGAKELLDEENVPFGEKDRGALNSACTAGSQLYYLLNNAGSTKPGSISKDDKCNTVKKVQHALAVQHSRG